MATPAGHSHRVTTTASGAGGAKPDINVTPLVDVVLVLLIIFMVVTPLLERELPVRVPTVEEVPATEPPPEDEDNVVLLIGDKGEITINNEPATLEDLGDRLGPLFKAKSDRVLFFAAKDDAPYSVAVDVLDRVRAAGIRTIAYMTELPELAPPEPGEPGAPEAPGTPGTPPGP